MANILDIIKILNNNNIWGENIQQLTKRAESLGKGGIATPEAVNRYVGVVKRDPNLLANPDYQSYIKGGYEGWATDLYKKTFNREPTPAEISDIVTGVRNNIYSTPTGSLTEYAKNFSLNPVGRNIAEREATEATNAEQQRQNTLTETLRPQIAQEYKPLEQAQVNLLNQTLGKQREEGSNLLSRTLAARGLGEGGSLTAGLTDIEKNIGEIASTGAQQIGAQSLAQQLAELGNRRAGLSSFNNEQRNAGFAGLAEMLANKEAERQAQTYWQKMQEMNAQKNTGSWLQPVAGLAGSIAGGPLGGMIGNAIFGSPQNTSNMSAYEFFKNQGLKQTFPRYGR